MADQMLPDGDKIFLWGHRHDIQVDESLIPPGKDPSIYPAENGLNLPEVFDASWSPED